MIRRARLRMFRYVRNVTPGSVKAWDQRTSMDDARIALQLAHGHHPAEISNQGYLHADLAAA